jgi:hypothetical protein
MVSDDPRKGCRLPGKAEGLRDGWCVAWTIQPVEPALFASNGPCLEGKSDASPDAGEHVVCEFEHGWVLLAKPVQSR